MSLEEEIGVLSKRLAAAEAAHARAEGARDNAQDTYDRALKTLQDEFVVKTLADAEQQLAELRRTIEQWAVEINTKLDEMEA